MQKKRNTTSIRPWPVQPRPGQLIKPRNMSAKAQRRRAIKAHNLQRRARALRRQREDG
jgi:hypothetical protein